MSARAPSRLPVRLAFDAEDGREDFWGRLERLSAARAVLSTQCELRRGQSLRLWFEVNGERFDEARARVTHVEIDDDGYSGAELEFEDPVDRRRLAKALADLLSRSL